MGYLVKEEDLLSGGVRRRGPFVHRQDKVSLAVRDTMSRFASGLTADGCDRHPWGNCSIRLKMPFAMDTRTVATRMAISFAATRLNRSDGYD